MIERDQINGQSIEDMQRIMEMVDHNLRLAGEANYTIRLNKLRLMPGMKLQGANTDNIFNVKRIFDNGQVLVGYLTDDDEEREHITIFGKHRLVRVPKTTK